MSEEKPPKIPRKSEGIGETNKDPRTEHSDDVQSPEPIEGDEPAVVDEACGTLATTSHKPAKPTLKRRAESSIDGNRPIETYIPAKIVDPSLEPSFSGSSKLTSEAMLPKHDYSYPTTSAKPQDPCEHRDERFLRLTYIPKYGFDNPSVISFGDVTTSNNDESGNTCTFSILAEPGEPPIVMERGGAALRAEVIQNSSVTQPLRPSAAAPVGHEIPNQDSSSRKGKIFVVKCYRSTERNVVTLMEGPALDPLSSGPTQIFIEAKLPKDGSCPVAAPTPKSLESTPFSLSESAEPLTGTVGMSPLSGSIAVEFIRGLGRKGYISGPTPELPVGETRVFLIGETRLFIRIIELCVLAHKCIPIGTRCPICKMTRLI